MNSHHDAPFSLIVPTFQEAKSIPELVKKISEVDFGTRKFEVLLIDDNSKDGTDEIVSQLKKQCPWLRLVVRQGPKGLSEAVIEGFGHAQYGNCVIMDADLSHPPEKIPEMLSALSVQDVDLVVGSRYIKGGETDASWPMGRKIVSRLAAFFTRVLLRAPVKDPLSGFLALKKNILIQRKLEPIGWKIGLEIIVKCHCKNVREVPIHFSERLHGASKLTHQVMMSYFKHVMHLLKYKMSYCFLRKKEA